MAVYSVNNSNGRFTLKLTLTEGAYSVADNSSPVTYKLELKANTAYNFENYGITSKVNLGGEEVHSAYKQYSIADYGTLVFAEGTKVIKHADDGSKELSFSYSIDMKKVDYTPGALSNSGTMSLVKIPRNATITYAPDFNDEQNPTIYFDNPAGFDLKLKIEVAENKGLIVRDKVTKVSPYTFELSEEERNALRSFCPNSNELDVRFTIATYIDGDDNEDFWSYLDKKMSIVNANPIFYNDNVTYDDANSTTKALTESQGQKMVSSMSLVNVTCGNATARKGASIVRYDVALGTASKYINSGQGGTAELGTITSNKDLTLYVSAVDSRGNYTTVEKTVSFIPYAEPKIALHKNFDYIRCERCDPDGTVNRKGENLLVAVGTKWSALSNLKNLCTVSVKCETKGENPQSAEVTLDITNGDSNNAYVSTGDFNGVVPGITLKKTKSYTVTIQCVDSLGKSAKVSYKIPTQAVDFHLKKGAAFGEYVTEENALKLSNEWTAIGLLGLGKCIQLSAGADANGCLDFRVYGISTSVASSISNLPEAVGGTLRVFSGDGLGMSATDYINIVQEFTTFSGNAVYRRRVRKDVKLDKWTFYAWVKYQQQI